MSLALGLNALCYLGMQLVWFQGDQTGNAVQLSFFGLLVANVLLTASFAFAGRYTAALRASGVFFLLANLESAVCALPPKQLVVNDDKWNARRRDCAYAGGVLVLISVLASFAAAMTNSFSAPAAGLGSRIASLRGLCFVLAAIFLLIASAVQWSWTQQCQADTRPYQAYPVTNGILVIVAFVFLIAIVYGDSDTRNLSVFLAAAFLLLGGYANPVFDSDNVKWEGQKNFDNKWKAAKGLSFIGAVLLLLSVWVTGKRGTRNGAALPFDLVAFALAIAGAVSVFSTRNWSTGFGGVQNHADYAVAYAIVITVLNLLQGLAGLDDGQFIATFFAAAVLSDFDNGSLASTSGYQRGGLQLCQSAVLLSTFFKAFPTDKPLSAYVDAENFKATAFGLVWTLLAMLRVPTNYSLCILIAVITYRAIVSKCPNWSRTAVFILAYFGVARSFPLTAAPWQVFGAGINDYVNTVAWLASAYFVLEYGFTCVDAEAAAEETAPAAAADEKAQANEPAKEDA
jgi:hypothetical protein